MLLPTLLAIALLGLDPNQLQKSNYSQVVEHPNPNNGYEDYVRATDILRGDRFSVYLNWSPTDYEDRLAQKKEALNQKESADDAWAASLEAQLQLSSEIRDLGFPRCSVPVPRCSPGSGRCTSSCSRPSTPL